MYDFYYCSTLVLFQWVCFCFFNPAATTEIYTYLHTLSLHDALPICIPPCLSTLSICSIEEVARASDPFWFQLYVIRDRAFMTDLVARAKAAGAQALDRKSVV